MSHYSDSVLRCRVDFFKPSGKWYTTVAVMFDTRDYEEAPDVALLRAITDIDRYRGMTAVCLEPYVKHSYPVMVTVP